MNVAKLVVFGGGGDTVYIDRNTTCTGYGSPERPHAADPKDGAQFPDGTPALDLRQAIETTEGYRWVFRGPMVDVDLPDDGVEECPQALPIMAAAMTSDPSNEFGLLLVLQAAHKSASNEPGPLDRVSVAAYVAGWVAHGARLGHYRNNVIEWAA